MVSPNPSPADTVTAIVRDRFADVIEMSATSVDLDADLVEVYGLESIGALKLISDVEVEFDIDIEPEEAQKIRSLNDVIKLVHAKRQAGPV